MSALLTITTVNKNLARLMSASGTITELTRDEALHLGQKLVRFGLYRGPELPSAMDSGSDASHFSDDHWVKADGGVLY